MVINKLYTLNLEELYRSCCVKQDACSKDSKMTFRSSLINLYNNIELTFILDDVSIYEYMLLKRFSTRTSKFNNKHILFKSPDYTSEIYNYAKLIHTITTDNEIVNTPIKYNYPYMYGPAFLVRGNCAITLSGRELISIFDIDPATFFITATNGKCFDSNSKILFDKKFDLSNIENHTMIINAIEQKFIKAFYNNFFISSTTSSDLVSDSSIHYYMSNHDSLIKLFSVSNPIFKYNIEKDDLKEKIDYISTLKKRSVEEGVYSHYLTVGEVLDNTYLIFTIYSRFSTYIDLFENLPKEFFISYEDLKVPSNFKEIYIPIEFYEKYHDKMEDVYDNLNMYIEHERKNFYVKYQCTYLNSMYSYSIKLKLDDINKYVNVIDRSRILPETKEIIKEIIKYGSAVLKMF